MTGDKIRELANRSDMHPARKVWHIACGAIALIIYHLSPLHLKFWGYFSLAISFIGFALDFARLYNPKFNAFAIKIMGPLMRKSERDGFSGLPFYALGIALAILFYQKEIALLVIMFLVFADPAASVMGIKFGHKKILPNKTVVGTLTCWFFCAGIVFLHFYNPESFSLHIIFFALIAGLIGAISEIFSAFNVDDNVTIPLVSGLGITLLNNVMPII